MKSTNSYKREHLKKARNAWAHGDMKSLTTILAKLSPVMTVEGFYEYNVNRASKHPTIK